MKLICVYSDSHQKLLDEWFLPSLRDEYEVELHKFENNGCGSYRSDDWSEAVQFKSETIIKTIKTNWGECFVYSDVDIQFFSLTRQILEKAIEGKDIVCQLDNPAGTLCTGFFVMRANQKMLEVWQRTMEAVKLEGRDQLAFNRIVKSTNCLNFDTLPTSFFGAGTFTSNVWIEGNRIYVPQNPCMFHANYTHSVEDKLKVHSYVRAIVQSSNLKRLKNNFSVLPEVLRGKRNFWSSTITNSLFVYVNQSIPERICLDASTHCQLNCRSCPNHTVRFKKGVGYGYLTVENFRLFIKNNPTVKSVELSNWGEVFLNPELKAIIKFASDKNIRLSANNGANFNNVSEDVLEALVKYQFHSISVSVDGCSNETYSQYRVNGDFNGLILNIRKLVDLKRKHNSLFPHLKWQFIAFDHNVHEIKIAKKLAVELGMSFYLKLSWDDLYVDSFSQVSDSDIVKLESGLGVSNREEYYQKYKKDYIAPTCLQLWKYPRINFDGRFLGCSVNYWGDYGNVFDQNLKTIIKGEQYSYAKRMLMGIVPEREDIPCSVCPVYKKMRIRGSWIKPSEIYNIKTIIKSVVLIAGKR